MEARLAPVYETFKLNSRLFLNCLDDLDDDRASWRPTAHVNSAGFIALHVVESRYGLAGLVGVSTVNPFAALTGDARTIDDIKQLPSLAEMRGAWKSVTGELRVRLGQMAAGDLAAPSPLQTPTDDPTVLGALAFLMQHESYHIGQLALLRKQLGLPAMSYR